VETLFTALGTELDPVAIVLRSTLRGERDLQAPKQKYDLVSPNAVSKIQWRCFQK
jgi:hypothetical protein